jgi:hypothetical protein
MRRGTIFIELVGSRYRHRTYDTLDIDHIHTFKYKGVCFQQKPYGWLKLCELAVRAVVHAFERLSSTHSTTCFPNPSRLTNFPQVALTVELRVF